MDFGLVHFYSRQNVGDAAILAALEHLTGCPELPHFETSDRLRSYTADVLVSPGGDIFNNARPGLVTRRFLGKLEQLRWRPECTILFGQSIPPSCRGVSLHLLATHLRRIGHVALRDRDSVERLRALGVEASLTADCVFALPQGVADTQSAAQMFAALDIVPERASLLTIRNFNAMYPADRTRYLEAVAETARLLRAAGREPVALVQADVNGADSDRAEIAALAALVPGLRALDPFEAEGEPWRIAAGAAAIAGSVIGTRYHTAVFRMLAGRMPVGLWYSCKGEDLHLRFGVPGAVADSFNPRAIVRMALDSESRSFDPAPLRARVCADFQAALAALSTRKKAA